MKFSARQLRKGMKWWPPFLGAGIRVRSLYAMTDPFFMIMLLYNLGEEYLVWDKEGRIEYVARVKKTLYVRLKPRHRPGAEGR